MIHFHNENLSKRFLKAYGAMIFSGFAEGFYFVFFSF